MTEASAMKITTNNQPRELLSFFEFSRREQTQIRREFDWLTDIEESTDFFKYKGEIYHLSDFMKSESIDGWAGCKADSYFSGLVVKISEDCESVIVGRFVSC